MTRKVCVVVTARPSYSRIKSALAALRGRPGIELQIVVGGSALLERYGSTVRQVRDDGFAVDAEISMVIEGENPTAMAKTTGIGLLELATVFDNLRPDVVVTIADRYETLATAIAASYMNLPLVHLLGGEVSGSIDEKVRHAVTKLSDLHFVATAKAADRVVRMGEDPERVFVTGCPSMDLAAQVAAAPELDFDPLERYGGVGAEIDLGAGYVVVLQHPVTTEQDLARAHVTETLEAVAGLDRPTIWFWPNVDAGSDDTSAGIRHFRETHDPGIHFFKNMSPEDFLRLVASSSCLVGNSSAGIRECSFLGVPVVNVGTRQAGRERGRNVLDVGYDRDEISVAIAKQVQNGSYEPEPIYGDGTSGERVADLLASVPLVSSKHPAS